MGTELLEDGQELIIAGGFKDNSRTVSIRRGFTVEIEDLKCDHEEADTRLLLQAHNAALTFQRIIINSPDTDVFILCLYHLKSMHKCEEFWFHTGTKDTARYIPIHSLFQMWGPQICQSLPAFHALTGCDSTSAIFGVGKRTAFKLLQET